ncbi:hypothetical protein V8C34DRAFT_277249 [Trichoderma compactum]
MVCNISYDAPDFISPIRARHSFSLRHPGKVSFCLSYNTKCSPVYVLKPYRGVCGKIESSDGSRHVKNWASIGIYETNATEYPKKV